MPAEQVPLIQRELIHMARRRNKAVIVATQMMESMIDHSRPTRAEVGDVANAALTGADAVMLSAETASGKYPLRAVEMMDRVATKLTTMRTKMKMRMRPMMTSSPPRWRTTSSCRA